MGRLAALLTITLGTGLSAPAAEAPSLTLSWERNYLTISGEHLPGKSMRILYLEAYCRANSQTTDWVEHTVVGHATKLVDASDDGRRIELECTLSDGVVVDHVITATHDEVDFRLVARNPTSKRSDAHWAQPCIRVGEFTGLGDPKNPRTYRYLEKSFVFIDGKLETMPTRDWATEARYVPGQVWAAPGVPRADVNPRPLSAHTPSNGLIGCFSADNQMLMATAFEPYQELFQGVITCIHSDFRLGGLHPGETRRIRGKIYFLKNDIPALLERYYRDFPEHREYEVERARRDATRRRAFGGLEPRLSPNGESIALSHQGAICVLPRSGGTLRRLTRGEGHDEQPCWSPDGATIAYLRDRQPRVVSTRDGSEREARRQARARGPLFFHPDGVHLLGRFSTGGGERIAWLDLEQGGVAPIEGIPASFATRRAPFALSHDGKRVAYATHADRPGEQTGNNGPSSELFVIPVEVSPEGRLHREGDAPAATAKRLMRFPARIYRLAWSGDGRRLFASSDFGGSHNDVWEIVSTAAYEPRARKLTFDQGDEDWPSTDSTGRFLASTRNARGATEVVLRDRHTDIAESVVASKVDFGEPSGRLRLELVDATTGEPVAARVSVRRRGGKFHAPFGSTYHVIAGLGCFWARHEATLELPAGSYAVRALRGPEYRVCERTVEVREGMFAVLDMPLERWTHAAASGWYSGENHIHANYGYGAWYSTPESILLQCEGEDLNVANLMVANSDGDGVFDREFFRGTPDPLSAERTILYWNEEFRSTIWGHLTLVNLDRLVEPIFTGFAGTTNPLDVPTNADIAAKTHVGAGIVSYTHPASSRDDPYTGAYSAKGLPVDVALGRIDTLDVMGWGYNASVPLWYRLLNCGFRIPAASGTDCFLNRLRCAPPGWGRTYVHLPDGLTYESWVRGQREGRSFISSGPILEWSLDGHSSGDTIAISAARELRVTARARADSALDRLELVVNGTVVASGEPTRTAAHEYRLDHTLRLDGPAWIAVRASGKRRPYRLGVLAAHANPVFVDVEGERLGSSTDAAFFLEWIDRLEAALRERDRIPSDLGHVEEQLESARRVFRRIGER